MQPCKKKKNAFQCYFPDSTSWQLTAPLPDFFFISHWALTSTVFFLMEKAHQFQKAACHTDWLPQSLALWKSTLRIWSLFIICVIPSWKGFHESPSYTSPRRTLKQVFYIFLNLYLGDKSCILAYNTCTNVQTSLFLKAFQLQPWCQQKLNHTKVGLLICPIIKFQCIVYDFTIKAFVQCANAS